MCMKHGVIDERRREAQDVDDGGRGKPYHNGQGFVEEAAVRRLWHLHGTSLDFEGHEEDL